MAFQLQSFVSSMEFLPVHPPLLLLHLFKGTNLWHWISVRFWPHRVIQSHTRLPPNFLMTLHGPIFFIFNLLYVPLGNISFLGCARIKSPTSNSSSHLCWSALRLYSWIEFCNHSLIMLWSSFIPSANSSTLALLNYVFSESFNSKTPLGCIPYTIWNGLYLVLLLSESL